MWDTGGEEKINKPANCKWCVNNFFMFSCFCSLQLAPVYKSKSFVQGKKSRSKSKECCGELPFSHISSMKCEILFIYLLFDSTVWRLVNKCLGLVTFCLFVCFLYYVYISHFITTDFPILEFTDPNKFPLSVSIRREERDFKNMYWKSSSTSERLFGLLICVLWCLEFLCSGTWNGMEWNGVVQLEETYEMIGLTAWTLQDWPKVKAY